MFRICRGLSIDSLSDYSFLYVVTSRGKAFTALSADLPPRWRLGSGGALKALVQLGTVRANRHNENAK
eukprot:scaffold457563_cov34-Prasinocladus_malaysianus.AAC.1